MYEYCFIIIITNVSHYYKMLIIGENGNEVYETSLYYVLDVSVNTKFLR